MTAVAAMLYALPIQAKSWDFSALAMVGSAVLMASWVISYGRGRGDSENERFTSEIQCRNERGD